MFSNFLLSFVLFLQIENNIKYIIALSAVIIYMTLLLKNKYKLVKLDIDTIRLLLLPQICIAFYSLLLGFTSEGEYLVENLKYIFFIIFPIVIAWCSMSVGRLYKTSVVKSVYYGLVCAYLIQVIRFAATNSLFAYVKGLFNSYDVYQNQLESNIVPFAAGILLLYFLLTEKKLKAHDFVLAGIVILNGKRIVDFALILIILLFFLFGRNMKLIRPLPCGFITFGYLLCAGIFLYLVSSMHLQSIFLKYGIMDSGRFSLYQLFQFEWELSPFFWGRGLGFCEAFLSFQYALTQNIHSDVMRMYIETGFIGYTVYSVVTCICSYKLSKKIQSALPFVLLIYFQIIYFTDNISIYISVLTVYYLVIFEKSMNSEQGVEHDTNIYVEKKNKRPPAFRKAL